MPLLRALRDLRRPHSSLSEKLRPILAATRPFYLGTLRRLFPQDFHRLKARNVSSWILTPDRPQIGNAHLRSSMEVLEREIRFEGGQRGARR